MDYSIIICKDRIVLKLVEIEPSLFQPDKVLNLFKRKGKRLSLRKRLKKRKKV